MKRAISTFYRDDRGNVLVMVGGMLFLLLLFSVYAIDMSQTLLVRTQLQNAADAGALYAALELGKTGDSSAAITAAMTATSANQALVQQGTANIMGNVDITPGDVEFPQNRMVRVTTHRTTATNDNFLNYFLRIFTPGGEIGEMTAHAAAEFFWVCGGKCLKPWAPPDRWHDEDGNGHFDSTAGDFYDPITTGYTNTDLGTQITLVLETSNKHDFGQDWYYSIDFPPKEDGAPVTGADQYREWICAECLDNSFTVSPGEHVQLEPGAMNGPNGQGLKCLIDLDPLAEWDAATGTVINSAYTTSPRIIKAALFDPSVGVIQVGVGKNEVVVTKIMALFIEQRQGNAQITGRFMRLSEPDGTVCENQANPTFLFKTLLTE